MRIWHVVARSDGDGESGYGKRIAYVGPFYTQGSAIAARAFLNEHADTKAVVIDDEKPVDGL